MVITGPGSNDMTDNHASPALGPIGVFDSGVGGLSVWRELAQRLPRESLLYLADQAHVPYGARPTAQVAQLTHAAVAWLIGQGAKMVVVACNTATAAALPSLRQQWPQIPIVGMEPAVKPACQQTKTGHVGVLATPGTLRASRFTSLVERFANGVQVYTLMGSGLVEMVENNQLTGPEVEARCRQIFAPVQTIAIDTLVLGCTHFPFLRKTLQNILGDTVLLIDPAPAVARQTGRILHQKKLARPHNMAANWQFVTTGPVAPFREALTNLVGDFFTAASPSPQIWHLPPGDVTNATRP